MGQVPTYDQLQIKILYYIHITSSSAADTVSLNNKKKKKKI